MKNKDFAIVTKQLLPELPGFAVKAPLMFIAPVTHTLRGLCFERTDDARRFYVWAFFLPLFIPRQYVSFDFGIRVGGGCHSWNADAPNLVLELGSALKHEALPFLLPIESPHDVARVAMSMRLPQDPHIQQAIAYSLARIGDMGKAIPALDELTRLLDMQVSWQSEMAHEAEVLKSKLLANPADGQCQLEAWEAESARKLGLEKFRCPVQTSNAT